MDLSGLFREAAENRGLELRPHPQPQDGWLLLVLRNPSTQQEVSIAVSDQDAGRLEDFGTALDLVRQRFTAAAMTLERLEANP